MNRIWRKTFIVSAVLVMVAAACGDDDDDTTSATSATTGATTATTTATTGATATTAAATGGSVAATGSTTATTGAASENPHVAEAKDPTDFLNRLAQLYPAAVKYSKPVPQVSGSTTQGVTDTTIKVGSVMAMTTPQGVEPFVGMCEAMMARLELENSKGGVKTQDGKTRRFEFAGDKDDKGRVCQDDKLDRDLSRQRIQDMVEGEKVFALLPVVSNGFFSGDYLNEKHIPYFGYAFPIDYCGPDRPFAFGAGGAAVCSVLGDKTFVSTNLAAPVFQALGVDPKTQRVALVGSSDPSSTQGNKIVQLSFEATGASVVTIDNSMPAPGAPSPTDFTPFVDKALEKDPTLIELVISAGQVEPMAKALKDAGYKGALYQFVFEDERLAAVAQNYPGIDGSYTGVGTGAPVGDTKGLSDIRAALDAAGFTSTPISTYALTGWNAADMLVEMIKSAAGPLTTESITNFANKGWAYPGYGDAVCPMSWPLGHYTSTPCWHVVQLDLTGANGATNSVGANGGKGGLLPKITRTYVDLFITDKPK
jgi:branched-chain amino acid transport system substrate-binding protein